MEPGTAAIAATAGTIARLALPAIRSLGERVLDKSEDSVSDATVGWGKRLLTTLFRGQEKNMPRSNEVLVLETRVERRVRAVAESPEEQRALIQLEGAIEDLLLADSKLYQEVARLVGESSKELDVRQGFSTHVGRDNRGVVITGNENVVEYGQ